MQDEELIDDILIFLKDKDKKSKENFIIENQDLLDLSFQDEKLGDKLIELDNDLNYIINKIRKDKKDFKNYGVNSERSSNKKQNKKEINKEKLINEDLIDENINNNEDNDFNLFDNNVNNDNNENYYKYYNNENIFNIQNNNFDNNNYDNNFNNDNEDINEEKDFLDEFLMGGGDDIDNNNINNINNNNDNYRNTNFNIINDVNKDENNNRIKKHKLIAERISNRINNWKNRETVVSKKSYHSNSNDPSIVLKDNFKNKDEQQENKYKRFGEDNKDNNREFKEENKNQNNDDNNINKILEENKILYKERHPTVRPRFAIGHKIKRKILNDSFEKIKGLNYVDQKGFEEFKLIVKEFFIERLKSKLEKTIFRYKETIKYGLNDVISQMNLEEWSEAIKYLNQEEIKEENLKKNKEAKDEKSFFSLFSCCSSTKKKSKSQKDLIKIDLDSDIQNQALDLVTTAKNVKRDLKEMIDSDFVNYEELEKKKKNLN